MAKIFMIFSQSDQNFTKIQLIIDLIIQGILLILNIIHIVVQSENIVLLFFFVNLILFILTLIVFLEYVYNDMHVQTYTNYNYVQMRTGWNWVTLITLVFLIFLCYYRINNKTQISGLTANFLGYILLFILYIFEILSYK